MNWVHCSKKKEALATGTTVPVNHQSPHPPGHPTATFAEPGPTPREVKHSNGPAKKHFCHKSLWSLLWAAAHSAQACPQ